MVTDDSDGVDGAWWKGYREADAARTIGDFPATYLEKLPTP